MDSFHSEFIAPKEDNKYPISLSDVVYMAPAVMEKAHKLKEQHPQIQYLRSLDCLHLASWVLTQQRGMKSSLITSDKRFFRIASAYKASEGYEAEVIDISSCSCGICQSI